MRFICIGLILSTANVAFALEAQPTVSVNDQGIVEGQIVLPANETAVRLVLADAVGSSLLSSDVYNAETRKEGNCEIVSRKVRGMWRPITYHAKRCPTKYGWIENLVKSDTVSNYYMEWKLDGLDNGTRVRYKIKTEFDLPVPTSIVQGETKRSVRKMLKNLFAKIIRKKNKK